MSQLPSYTSLTINRPNSVTTELVIQVANYDLQSLNNNSDFTPAQLNLIVGAVVTQVIKDEEIDFIGNPQISYLRKDANAATEIRAVLGHLPSVKLVQYKGLKVEIDYSQLESKTAANILSDVAIGIGSPPAGWGAEEYAKLGIDNANFFELHKRAQVIAEQDSRSSLQKALEPLVCKELIRINGDFEIPQVLIDDRIRMLLVERGIFHDDQEKADSLDVEEYRADYTSIALQRIKLELILDQIVKQERISPSEEQLRQEISRIASELNVQEQIVLEHMLSEKRILGSLVKVARILALRNVIGWVEIVSTR